MHGHDDAGPDTTDLEVGSHNMAAHLTTEVMLEFRYVADSCFPAIWE